MGNTKTYRAIWKNTHLGVFQRPQITLVLQTRAIWIVFEDLTRSACFQIALETMLLTMLIYAINYANIRYFQY